MTKNIYIEKNRQLTILVSKHTIYTGSPIIVKIYAKKNKTFIEIKIDEDLGHWIFYNVHVNGFE